MTVNEWITLIGIIITFIASVISLVVSAHAIQERLEKNKKSPYPIQS